MKNEPLGIMPNIALFNPFRVVGLGILFPGVAPRAIQVQAPAKIGGAGLSGLARARVEVHGIVIEAFGHCKLTLQGFIIDK